MGLASKKPQTPSFPALDLVLYLFELFRVTSAELVKWGDANETKREQRERERSHPVLVDGGSFVRCACRCGFDASRANRAGRCASVPTGGSGSFRCSGHESDARSCGGTARGAQGAGETVAWIRFLVWWGLQWAPYRERRSVQPERNDGMSSDIAVRHQGAGGEHEESPGRSGADYGSRDPVWTASDRSFVCRC